MAKRRPRAPFLSICPLLAQSGHSFPAVLWSRTDNIAEDGVRTPSRAGIALALLLPLGCAHPEDSSFGVQAARRGEDCKAIATGSAMDAYSHGVGPAEAVYDDVKQDCLAWQRRQAERQGASIRPRPAAPDVAPATSLK